jgi:multiple sugar transport system permease protein
VKAATAARRARPGLGRRLAHLSPYLYLLPATVLMVGFIYYPILSTLVMSFGENKGLSMRSTFVGLRNYEFLLNDAQFRQVIGQTVLWTGGVLVGTIVIALYLATLLNLQFPGRKFVRSVILIPWATSLVITAVAYHHILNPDYGHFSAMLRTLGFVSGRVAALANPETAWPVLIFIGIMVSVPFSTIALLAGMQSVSHDLLEAAQLDGANAVQRYRYVVLPHLRPVLVMVTLINFIGVFNSFPIIWTLTAGGPVISTHIIVTFLYIRAFRFIDFGIASAMSMLTFGMVFTASLFYLRLVYRHMGAMR